MKNKILLTVLCLFCLVVVKACKTKPKEYDFVVVGGGLAGCIVATRLSENSRFSVVLIEAGGDPPLISEVPMLSFLLMNSKYDWNYTTIAQINATNRVFGMIRGKMLGGSGSLNTLNWFRGNKRDYDIWENEGARGWDWNSLLPYFKKTETDLSTDANSASSGFHGPIPLTSPWENITLYSTFISEMHRRGYSSHDPSDGDQHGYNVVRLNLLKNLRKSTYTNYLRPGMKRRNLKVIKNALVTKILFNEQREAIGVTYEKNGEIHKIKAKREVIVSGGAINTPQLLMLSGIGPRQHLESFNIEVISDLPVGDHFQDHVMLRGNFTKKVNNIFTPETLQDFFNGHGPLTNYSAVSNFANTDISSNLHFPDIQLTTVGQFYNPIPSPRLIYQMWFYIQRPKSFGSIRLQSTNARQYPMIDPKYLSEEYDMQILTRLVKELKNISEAMYQSQNEYSMTNVDDTQCTNFSSHSDEYWRCVVRTNIQQACHFCCSCRMGSPEKSTSVVDNELKVLGVKKLRVIDASVMPSVPSSNIQAVVAMIAEKGSDLVKKSHL